MVSSSWIRKCWRQLCPKPLVSFSLSHFLSMSHNVSLCLSLGLYHSITHFLTHSYSLSSSLFAIKLTFLFSLSYFLTVFPSFPCDSLCLSSFYLSCFFSYSLSLSLSLSLSKLDLVLSAQRIKLGSKC